jgi:hypothetical protein
VNIYEELTEKIIKEQENVIGPIALEQAKKVSGLTINWDKHEVIISGNEKDILEQLVNNYKHLFGQASVEVCKDAVKNIISKVPADKIPSQLQ